MKAMGATCQLIIAEGQGHGWKTPLPNEMTQFVHWFDQHLRADVDFQGTDGKPPQLIEDPK
jgi:hypothetical protein